MADTPCRCLECATHVKCVEQVRVEQLLHEMAAALETREPVARVQALVNYDQWREGR
jgi:hypothetical protein